ncbi:MAG: hypothetical protein HOP02_00925 [Methylococcaceae bacterium]|nr:hypothetical protein [Methylococcaceae bacterium]
MQSSTSPAPTLDDILRLFQETDRRFQETDRIRQETVQSFKTVNTIVGNLGNRLGQFVEESGEMAIIWNCVMNQHFYQRRGNALSCNL